MAATRSIGRILAAVDFSEHADVVLDTAVDFAMTLGAELHVVHACDVRIPMLAPYGATIPPALIEEARDVAASKLAALTRKVVARGVAASSHVAGAPAASAIIELAEELGVDLIIMGTRGHTGLKHVLLGSVTERTLRHAPCWVLAVKESSGSARLGQPVQP